MARVFALDVLECPRCRSRMRLLEAIEDPVVASHWSPLRDSYSRQPLPVRGKSNSE